MASDGLDCTLCLLRYTPEGTMTPRILPCGHTYCCKCLHRFQKKCCPVDNVAYTNPDQLPKNFALLSLLKAFETKVPLPNTSVIDNMNYSISELQELMARVQKRLEDKKVSKMRDLKEKRESILKELETIEIEITVLGKRKLELAQTVKEADEELKSLETPSIDKN